METMTPEQVGQWIASHGGPAGGEGPDASGRLVQRAADGSYIVQQRGVGGAYQVVDVKEAKAASAAAPASSSTSAASAGAPGGGMDQQALEERLRQLAGGGDTSKLRYSPTVTRKRVKNPASARNGGTDADALDEIDVVVQGWEDPTTGARLEAYTMPDGSYVIDKDTPGTKPAATATGTKPPIPPGGSASTEGTPDASKPGGWDNNRPREVIKDKDGNVVWSAELQGADLTAWRNNQQAGQPQTGEIKKPVDGRPGWTSITRATTRGGNKTEITVFVGPDGKEVATLPEKPGEPKTTLSTINGQPGYRTVVTPQGQGTPDKVEYFDPSGKSIPQLPGETTSKESQVVKNGRTLIEVTTTEGGKTKTVYLDPSTRQQVTLPGDPDATPPPPGMPRYTPDLTKPGGGLWAYRDQLDAWIEANPGKMSWTQRQAVIAEASKLADSLASQWNSATTILREQYQTDVSQRGQDLTTTNNRASLANQHFQNATALIERFAPYLGVTPGDAGRLFMGTMAAQLATTTMYGGMKDTPQVQMDPRLTAFADRTMPGATGPAAPAVPGVAQSGPLPNPDIALAEAINQARAASGQPLPPPVLGPSPDARGVPPQAGTVVAPPMPGIPGAAPVAPAPPVAGPSGAPPIRDDWRTTESGAPAQFNQNPAAGPVGMAPNPAIESLFSNVLPPIDPPSWHEQAQSRAFSLETPSARHIATGERLLGHALPNGPMFGGFDLGGPGRPLLALDSRVPGMTPEIDEIARRELMAEMGGIG